MPKQRTFDDIITQVMKNLKIKKLEDQGGGWESASVAVPTVKPYVAHQRGFWVNHKQQVFAINNSSGRIQVTFSLKPLRVTVEQCDFLGAVAARPCGDKPVPVKNIRRRWTREGECNYGRLDPIHRHMVVTALQGL